MPQTTLLNDLGFTEEKVKNGLLYSNFAYKEGEKADIIEKQFPKGCELFLRSDVFDETKGYEYRCAVIIDKKNKVVNFAIPGTRLKLNSKGYHDVVDDVRLSLGLLPNKFESASKFNDLIIQKIPQADLKNWKFHYAGHSLGAVMSNIGAADLALKLKKKDCLVQGQVSSIGFDNPGAKSLVEKIYKDNHIDTNQATKDVQYLNINNGKNFINKLNKQIGDTHKIVKEQDSFSTFMSYIRKAFSYISGITPPFLKKLLNVITRGNPLQQVSDHRLPSFVDQIENNCKVETPDKVITNLYSAIYKSYIIPYDKDLVEKIEEQRRNGIKYKEMDILMKDDQGHKFLANKSEIRHVSLLMGVKYNQNNFYDREK